MSTRKQHAIQFNFCQSLTIDSDAQRWSELLDISVVIRQEAITSGFFRENFSGRGGLMDFAIVIAIVMHARPLIGTDLDMMVGLQMATPDDEGRLYARVTDMGLADELGIYRETIAAAAKRLHARGLIQIVDIPERITNFRDSRGQFNGSKVYLLSGALLNMGIEKQILPTAEQTYRAGLNRTVEENTVRSQTAPGAAGNRTNRRRREDEKKMMNFNDSQVFDHFAEKKKAPRYIPSSRDRKSLGELRAMGYSLEEIIAGIDNSFARRASDEGPIRSFTYCAQVVKDLPPAAKIAVMPNPETATANAKTQNKDPNADVNAETDAAAVTNANCPDTDQTAAMAMPQPANSQKSDEEDDFVYQIQAIYEQVEGQPPNAGELARYRILAKEYDEIAQQTDQSGEEWVLKALMESIGRADNLLFYTIKILKERRKKQTRYSYQQFTTDATPISTATGPAIEADSEADRLWDQVKGLLQQDMGHSTYQTWIAHTYGITLEDNVLSVAVSNKFGKQWLENRVQSSANDILKGLRSLETTVDFVVY